MIRIFVGTDDHMGKAETVLEHSIRKHASEEVDITWMRAGDEGWTVGSSGEWNIGREKGNPYPRHNKFAKGGEPGWATDFTCFRFAIPELCEFEGSAIYLDVDMALLTDIAQLHKHRQPGKWVCVGQRTDVCVIDCSAFKDPWWPSLAKMKASGWMVPTYCAKMQAASRWLTLGMREWDCIDGAGYHPKQTKLYHWSDMRTQPWHPWPEAFDYRKHPHPEGEKLFWDLYREATDGD